MFRGEMLKVACKCWAMVLLISQPLMEGTNMLPTGWVAAIKDRNLTIFLWWSRMELWHVQNFVSSPAPAKVTRLCNFALYRYFGADDALNYHDFNQISFSKALLRFLAEIWNWAHHNRRLRCGQRASVLCSRCCQERILHSHYHLGWFEGMIIISGINRSPLHRRLLSKQFRSTKCWTLTGPCCPTIYSLQLDIYDLCLYSPFERPPGNTPKPFPPVRCSLPVEVNNKLWHAARLSAFSANYELCGLQSH